MKEINVEIEGVTPLLMNSPAGMLEPKDEMSSKPPIYNPRVHKAGDRVRMRSSSGKMIEITVPEIDGEGNPIP